MQTLELKRVEKSDLLDLQSLSRQTFTETFGAVNTDEDMQHYLSDNLSLKQLENEWEQEGTSFYMLKADNKWVGYLKLNRGEAQTEYFEKTLEIERIYVLKDRQGEGLGFYMFQKALEWAKECKARNLWLGVWEHNHKAIHFYEKLGMTVFGKHDFQLGNDIQTDLLMKLDLG